MKEFFMCLIASICVISLVSGLIEATGRHHTTGCTYDSIASYSPPRILVCELFRKRF